MNKKSELTLVQIWMHAARPKTLLAAFVPVLVGTSVALAEHKLNATASSIALICALLIQVGTNFTNDLYDFLRGADNKKRVGPIRVLNEGLVSPAQMKFAIALSFGSAFALGLYLVYIGGIFILIIGIFSIIAGLAYTAGPFPLAYKGLGDVFVFIFFGFIGTCGTYFVNAQSLSMNAVFASFPVGALITNILVVNNFRDIDTDRVAGKNTLAVLLGKKFSLVEYISLVFLSFITPAILYFEFGISEWIFLPYLTIPLAFKLIRMMTTLSGSELNKTLELTAKFSAIFGVLLSLGFIL